MRHKLNCERLAIEGHDSAYDALIDREPLLDRTGIPIGPIPGINKGRYDETDGKIILERKCQVVSK